MKNEKNPVQKISWILNLNLKLIFTWIKTDFLMKKKKKKLEILD